MVCPVELKSRQITVCPVVPEPKANYVMSYWNRAEPKANYSTPVGHTVKKFKIDRMIDLLRSDTFLEYRIR